MSFGANFRISPKLVVSGPSRARRCLPPGGLWAPGGRTTTRFGPTTARFGGIRNSVGRCLLNGAGRRLDNAESKVCPHEADLLACDADLARRLGTSGPGGSRAASRQGCQPHDQRQVDYGGRGRRRCVRTAAKQSAGRRAPLKGAIPAAGEPRARGPAQSAERARHAPAEARAEFDKI